MCGRYSLTTAPEALRRLFNFTNVPNLAPRYNIAPTQTAPVVRRDADGGDRTLAMLRWGLIPSWARDAAIGSRTINARAETVSSKPSFRSAFRHRRCLVPSDGFYEWRTENGVKQPFRIGMKGGEPFALAGLWERWTPPAEDTVGAGPEDGPENGKGEAVETFTIVTTEANEKLRPIHPRMPVIVDPADYDLWLGGDGEGDSDGGDALRAILGPFAPELMAFYRVSTRVNNVRNDDPACIEPLARTSHALHGLRRVQAVDPPGEGRKA